MTLDEAYQEFTAGSDGFCRAVASIAGYDITRDEARRIAEKAETAEEFQNIWENEDWWKDR